MSALGLATRGVIRPCCGDGPTPPPDTKYTGFIRKEEIAKPVIKVERFYTEDNDKHTIKRLEGTVKVTSAKFVINEGESE